MFTLQELFKSSWTEETAEAWNKLFMFIKDQMVRGLQSRAWTPNKTSEHELPSMNSKQHFQLIYRLGGGGGRREEDWGLNKVTFSQSPLWMSLNWNDHPYNFWWPPRPPPPPPPCLHLPSKFECPPLNPSKFFSDPSFWVRSYDWSPLLSS